MKVILFGASGMVGQGVLRECLVDPEVESVLSIGRSELGVRHDKLREIIHGDFTDFSSLAAQLIGLDACFFCLGVSSVGMSEADYRRITYDYTMAAANVLLQTSPGLVFIYVTGKSTDSTEKGGTMWARVKGQTENALLRMPFKGSYMFRPAYIQPRHGVVSRTRATRIAYAVMAPLYPVWKRLMPGFVTTTEHLGRAMLKLAKHGGPKRVLESRDIEEIGREP